MHKKIITAGLTLVSFSMVGGMAYAATQSVSTRPSPQVVIPAAARSDDRPTATNATIATTVDDRRPDADDDRVTATAVPPTPVPRTTVPSTTVRSTTVPSTTVPSTTVPDDRGRQAEPGDDRGGSGSRGPSTPAISSGSNSGRGSINSGPSGSGSGKSGKDG